MCGRVVVLCAVDGRDVYTTTQPTTTAKIKFSLPLYIHVETVFTHYKDNASTTGVKIATFRHLFYSIYYCYCGSDGLCGRTHTPWTSTAQNTTNTKKTFKNTK